MTKTPPKAYKFIYDDTFCLLLFLCNFYYLFLCVGILNFFTFFPHKYTDNLIVNFLLINEYNNQNLSPQFNIYYVIFRFVNIFLPCPVVLFVINSIKNELIISFFHGKVFIILFPFNA